MFKFRKNVSNHKNFPISEKVATVLQPCNPMQPRSILKQMAFEMREAKSAGSHSSARRRGAKPYPESNVPF